jgi:PII-like signaling protein
VTGLGRGATIEAVGDAEDRRRAELGPEASRLRLICGESDTTRGHTTFVEVVHRAREAGLAGATVLPAFEGFGGSSRLHVRRLFQIVSVVPVAVILVDDDEPIDALLPDLRTIVPHGLLLRQRVEIVGSRSSSTTQHASSTSSWQMRHVRGDHMRLEGAGKRLTIYCGEDDRHDHQSLAKAIVEFVREEGLAGATVMRGIEGFGASSVVHTARIVDMSSDLPIVIEIVDREDRIRAVLPDIEAMLGDGLMTLEDVDVWLYRAEARHALDDAEQTPTS